MLFHQILQMKFTSLMQNSCFIRNSYSFSRIDNYNEIVTSSSILLNAENDNSSELSLIMHFLSQQSLNFLDTPPSNIPNQICDFNAEQLYDSEIPIYFQEKDTIMK